MTLTEPELIKLTFEAINAFCPDKPDGEIKLGVSGGIQGTDYSYLWSDKSTKRNISDLLAGKYFVTVTDANTCSVSGSVTVHSEHELCLIMS